MQQKLPISSAARRERLNQIQEFGAEALDRVYQTWSCPDCQSRFETGGLAPFLLSRPEQAVAHSQAIRNWVLSSLEEDRSDCPACEGEDSQLTRIVLVCYSEELQQDICFEFQWTEQNNSWLSGVTAIDNEDQLKRISLADPSLKSVFRDVMLRHVAISMELDGQGQFALDLLNSTELELGESRRSIVLRGCIHRELKQYDLAVRTFQRLLDESAPRDILYEIGLTHFASLQSGEDKHLEAYAVFNGLIELYPDFASPYLYLGNVLMALGDDRQALEHFQLAAEREPDMLAAHFNSALLEMSNDNFKAALSHLLRSHEIAPRDIDVLSKLRDCYAVLNEAQKSLEVESIIDALLQQDK